VDSLRQLAARLDESAALLSDAAHMMPAVGPPAPAFGVDGPGRLGELGRTLHGVWVDVVGARAREAATTAARLADAATALRAISDAYADADEAARRRRPEGV
jgi:hypothetical protein